MVRAHVQDMPGRKTSLFQRSKKRAEQRADALNRVSIDLQQPVATRFQHSVYDALHCFTIMSRENSALRIASDKLPSDMVAANSGTIESQDDKV
jgi:hypothetical protein